MACEPLGKEDFLQLWKEILPSSYAGPIESERGGRGMDVPCLQAAIWAAFLEGVEVSWQSYYVREHSEQTRPPASGSRKATGSVLVHRAAPAQGDITIPAGTLFAAWITNSFGARVQIGTYAATEAVRLLDGQTMISVPVESLVPGWATNIESGLIDSFVPQGRLQVSAQVIAQNAAARVPAPANDTFGDEVIGRLVRLSGPLVSPDLAVPRRVVSVTTGGGPNLIVFDPPLGNPADVGVMVQVEIEEFEDFGLTVTQPAPITGGATAALDAAAVDRALLRSQGEDDASLRERFGELADTVSPAALIRKLDCILGPCGIRWTFSETRDVETLAGFILDVHPLDYGQITPISKLPGSQYVGQRGVLMDRSTATRFFLVTVSMPDVAGFGLAFDDGPYPNALDGPQPLDGQLVAQDGSYIDCIARAYAELDGARAAGVGFVIVQDPNL